jgi:hypothetical protein
MPRIHEVDLEAARFEDLVHRNPKDARGLHRHAGHPTGHEPVGQPMQIGGKRAE